ncbi:MAG: sulfatase-like hydrolase/transferase [Verrucomicrobia bacterium]|nr:sulfatase-like hydrolase/transferase [Verrucomicrobiota bacterium]
MKITLTLLIALLLAPLAALHASDTPKPVKPNIILMLVDDLGYECLGANGSKTFRDKTPVVDKLATGGMRFAQAFMQACCTPTRVSLMTGKCNARNYVHFGLLEKSQTTFGHLFRDAGYATCIVGKWQLGGSVAENTAKHFGFDEHCLYHIHGTPKDRGKDTSDEYSSRYINPGLVMNGQTKKFSGNVYAPDICNDFVLDYLTRHASPGKAFFLYYPMMLTHAPFDPTPDSSDYPGKNGAKRSGFEHYQDMVAYNDKLIGKILDKLDQLGLRNNTLLLFTGDNGTPGKFTVEMNDGTPIHSGKGETARAGLHVPLVANWPGTIPAGKVCGDLVDVTDVLPTICDAAGTKLPPDFLTDGRSFFPQLRGEKGNPREWIYRWYCPLMNKPQRTVEMAFTRDFKLYKTGEFYDWRTDSGEEKPLKIAKLTGVATEAAKTLQAAIAQFKEARPPAIQAQADELAGAKQDKRQRRAENKEKKQTTRSTKPN